MLSLLNQHVRQLVRLDPKSRRVELLDHQKRVRQVELAESHRKKSIAKKVKSCYNDRAVKLKTKQDTVSQTINESLDAYETLKLSNARGAEQQGKEFVKDLGINRKEMMQAAFSATRSIYGVVILAALSVFGILLIALTISWNNNSFGIRNGMVTFLEVTTVLFQMSFAAATFFLWDGGQLLALIDTVFCVVAPFADFFWFKEYETSSELSEANVARYCILIGYMTARFWSTTVKPRHRSWKKATLNNGVASLDRLELVWICRSTALASELLPIMDETWSRLVKCWGMENARAACRLEIYITDKDANEQLRREIENTAIYQSGAIHFGRPDLEKIIENHTLNLIATRRSSCSVLAFCGSPVLSLSLHQHKISNDMLTAITGNKRHQMEYVSESYGGVKKSNPKQQLKDDGKKSAAKKSGIHLRETAPDEGEADLHGSFATQSTSSVSSDEEDLMNAV
jgi:ABC-type multidrug transport system fused ATPase/permease subunit